MSETIDFCKGALSPNRRGVACAHWEVSAPAWSDWQLAWGYPSLPATSDVWWMCPSVTLCSLLSLCLLLALFFCLLALLIYSAYVPFGNSTVKRSNNRWGSALDAKCTGGRIAQRFSIHPDVSHPLVFNIPAPGDCFVSRYESLR